MGLSATKKFCFFRRSFLTRQKPTKNATGVASCAFSLFFGLFEWVGCHGKPLFWRSWSLARRKKKPTRSWKIKNLDFEVVLPLLTLVSQLDLVVWRRPGDHIKQHLHVDSFSGLKFIFFNNLHLQLGTSTP